MRRAIARAAMAAMLAMTAAGRAEADMIVDQSNAGPLVLYYSIATYGPLGQSFTPTLPSISFATFGLESLVNSPASLAVQLRTGLGTLLATSMTVTIPASGAGNYQFDFAAPIALTPGASYSLILAQVSGPSGIYLGASSTLTPGSSAIFQGQARPNLNFVFSEGTTALGAAVPEPSSAALLGIGLAGAGVVGWRRPRRPAGVMASKVPLGHVGQLRASG